MGIEEQLSDLQRRLVCGLLAVAYSVGYDNAVTDVEFDPPKCAGELVGLLEEDGILARLLEIIYAAGWNDADKCEPPENVHLMACKEGNTGTATEVILGKGAFVNTDYTHWRHFPAVLDQEHTIRVLSDLLKGVSCSGGTEEQK